MTKLSWEFENGSDCEVAWHNGYRIRAERDDHPENLFEDRDGHWPMQVRSDGRITDYDRKLHGVSIQHPLNRFNDDALVHDQKAIAALLGRTIRDISIEYDDRDDDDEEPANYIRDADILRHAFEHEFDYGIRESDKFEVIGKLYDILGIPNLVSTSRGYCQGDYAELLVVATPEACADFGCAYAPLTGFNDAHVAAWWEQQLEKQVDLYGAWAWGDVYGYVVEFAIYDEDGEIEDWEEVEHGSCWGYYGADHAESGLEGSALDAVPEEPAPGVPEPVRSSDALLEIV